MKITKDDFYVGQELILLYNERDIGDLYPITVKDIDDKYIYLDENKKGFRIDLSSDLSKRLYSTEFSIFNGNFFFNKEDYQQYCKSRELQIYIQRNICKATHLSIDELKQIEKLIKGDKYEDYKR